MLFPFFFFSAALGKIIALLHRVSAVGEVKCERFRHAAKSFSVGERQRAHENWGAGSPRSRNTLTSVFLVDLPIYTLFTLMFVVQYGSMSEIINYFSSKFNVGILECWTVSCLWAVFIILLFSPIVSRGLRGHTASLVTIALLGLVTKFCRVNATVDAQWVMWARVEWIEH